MSDMWSNYFSFVLVHLDSQSFKKLFGNLLPVPRDVNKPWRCFLSYI